MKTINTVLSKNMLHKINKKKRELPFEYHKAKFKLFKNVHFESFLRFQQTHEKFKLTKALKNLRINKTNKK